MLGTAPPGVAMAKAKAPLRLGPAVEVVVIVTGALLTAAAIFSLFLLAIGHSPVRFFELVYIGGFGSSFSFQNTLRRAAPLILTGLAFAIPARIGLTMIGAEGALVIGALAAAALAVPIVTQGWPVALTLTAMALAAVFAGGLWTGFAGWLRHSRGVNETISTLLLAYIATAVLFFFVEGPLRDPGSANRPSTMPIGRDYMIGTLPGTNVHWGLVAGILCCIVLWLVMSRTTFGFAVRLSGGNPRAALAQGLPVGKLVVLCAAIAGGLAGLAGFFEVAAVHGQANAALVAGYGFTGILVAFLARQNPLAIIPVAILFGALAASGGLIQRRMGLPDASVLVLQGTIFVTLLAAETLYGRFKIFRPRGDER
ncbi:MAG: ABC transporter permease [Geminicoccaceae bacterium]|nr:MAG: ABC transporter permease [Geminicoccaceae bacterium]